MANRERSILLVEDNPDDVDLTLRALKRNNITNEVVVARDGVEAMDYLLGRGSYAGRDACSVPDVILLDLKLPKETGVEVLDHIRAHPNTRHVPVVMLTSSTHERDLIECYRHGCNSYVQKPVDFIRFTEVVRELGLYWLVLNELPPHCQG